MLLGCCWGELCPKDISAYIGYSMDKRQCTRCCVVKALGDFKDTRKYCQKCLEKERENYPRTKTKKGRGGRRITQIIRQKFLKKEKNTKKILAT